MSAKNDITGDAIASKANSTSYRDNYENIFAKKATEKRVEEAAIASIEFNFCPRCGKRTHQKDWVHTCTPPLQENRK